jgi:hypothetical protein
MTIPDPRSVVLRSTTLIRDTLTRGTAMNEREQEQLTGPDEVDSTELSWAAETADGTRDKELFLVLEDGKYLKVKAKLGANDKEVRKVRTKSKREKRKKVVEVLCTVKEWKEPARFPSAEEWDALFWTESAIEKFLYPYYHAQRLWNDEIEKVKKKFDRDDDAVAIAHRAPSHSLAIDKYGLQTLGVARVTREREGFRVTVVPGPEYLELALSS